MFPSSGESSSVAQARVELHLNPTRFLAHHPLPYDDLAAADPEVVLQRNEDVAAAVASTTLGSEDNLLTPPHSGQARPFSRYALLYITKVTQLFDRIFLRYADPSSLLGDWDIRVYPDWRNWTVQHVEAYWETRHREALPAVYRMRRHLRAIAADAEETTYPVPRAISEGAPERPRWRTRLNALSLSVGLGANGVSLHIYAKQHDRVRFEVRFKRNARQILGPSGNGATIGTELDDLSSLFDALIQTAHRRLRRVFQRLAEDGNEGEPSLADFFNLINRLTAAADGDLQAAERLLTLLVYHGGISRTEDESLVAAISTLEVEGVLVEVSVPLRRVGRRYVLAPQYQGTARVICDALVSEA